MLKDKVAIVTGGTRGIGDAIVRLFLQNNAKVVFTGSRAETVEKASAALEQDFPKENFLGLYPKLTDENEVEELFKTTVEKFGKVDILVNNAGVSSVLFIDDYPMEEINRVIDLNVKAVIISSKYAANYMKNQKSGSIVNISSIVSIYGAPTGVAYPASKFAVNGITKSLARELGPHNVRVNAVAPGIIETDMAAAAPKEALDAVVAQIALGRIGQPEEIAEAVLFLASDKSSFVTGTIIQADGGGIN